jgi:hypothetical protein
LNSHAGFLHFGVGQCSPAVWPSTLHCTQSLPPPPALSPLLLLLLAPVKFGGVTRWLPAVPLLF